jgi:hypothetical protein
MTEYFINNANLKLILHQDQKKDYLENRFSPPELNGYLVKNKLGLTFVAISNGHVNYLGRVLLLKEKIERFKSKLVLPNYFGKNPYIDMVKIHCEQLDLLSNIFIFMEDFLAYSFNLKESLVILQKFPVEIASENYNTAREEIKTLKNKKELDIHDYLLFPDVNKMKISNKERKLVNEKLAQISKDVHTRIQNIVTFYNNYYRVYLKYKHILPAIMGLHKPTPHRSNRFQKNISSHIYIRDYNKNQIRTYIIGCDLETLTYYEDIIKDIGSVFQLLLISYLHYLMNYGNRVLVPIGTYIEENEKQKWARILRTNRVKVLLPKYKTEINISGDLAKALAKMLPKDHIYAINRDIFNEII